MAAPTRITLTGVFGVGKTTVANLVAQRLGWDAVDADDVLVGLAGKEVAAIFEEQGEAIFRQTEAEALMQLAARIDVVVAAGGGAPVYEPSRRRLLPEIL